MGLAPPAALITLNTDTSTATRAPELGGKTLTSSVYSQASGTFGITGILTMNGGMFGLPMALEQMEHRFPKTGTVANFFRIGGIIILNGYVYVDIDGYILKILR